MTDAFSQDRIDSFASRFGQPHLVLAMHAAFPLALTPDMLYRLWGTFVSDEYDEVLEIPWIAVADVLLAGFTSEVRRDTFQIDRAVQHALLDRLLRDTRFGPRRLQALSTFVSDYYAEAVASAAPAQNRFARLQTDVGRLLPIAYMSPQLAVRRLQRIAKNGASDTGQLTRLAALVEAVGPPLQSYDRTLRRLLQPRGGQPSRDVRTKFQASEVEAASAEPRSVGGTNSRRVKSSIGESRPPIKDALVAASASNSLRQRARDQLAGTDFRPPVRALVVELWADHVPPATQHQEFSEQRAALRLNQIDPGQQTQRIRVSADVDVVAIATSLRGAIAANEAMLIVVLDLRPGPGYGLPYQFIHAAEILVTGRSANTIVVISLPRLGGPVAVPETLYPKAHADNQGHLALLLVERSGDSDKPETLMLPTLEALAAAQESRTELQAGALLHELKIRNPDWHIQLYGDSLAGIPPPNLKALSAPLPPPSKVRRLLWVDDELNSLDNQHLLAELKHFGVSVVQAESTGQAMLQLPQNKEGFDLVLSDMGRMEPETGVYNPMAGIDLFRAMRRVFDQLPFIFYTTSRGIRTVQKQLRGEPLVLATASTTQVIAALGYSPSSPTDTAVTRRRRAPPGIRRKSRARNDPQKGRWGGTAERAGYRLSAAFGKERRGVVSVALSVAATVSGQHLSGTVTFYLHDTFADDEIPVEAVDGVAQLKLRVWGGFTVGAWLHMPAVELELDLAELPEAPQIVKES